jgi:hypothetical protein
MIANRNVVQRQIGQAMLDLSRGSIGDQVRRVAISNSDPAGTGTHWFTVCFEVTVVGDNAAPIVVEDDPPSKNDNAENMEYSRTKHPRLLDQTNQHHRTTLHEFGLPHEPGAFFVIPFHFTQLKMRMRIVDYLYAADCSSDWLAQWARSIGWDVSIGDSTDHRQIGFECGSVAAAAEPVLHRAGTAFMSADTSGAVRWTTTCDHLQWLSGRDAAGDLVFSTAVLQDGDSERTATADEEGRQTYFLSGDEVSHLVERGRLYPDLESFTTPGMVNIRFYLKASPVLNDTLVQVIGTLVESVLTDNAELCGAVRLAILSLYDGVLSVSARVQLLGQCTTARVHQILQGATFDLTQGGDPVQPTHVRYSPLLFEQRFYPRYSPSPAALRPITDFPIIANRNVVQREIAKTMHRLATNAKAGDQRRRTAISNADPTGAGTHWFTVCFEVTRE